MKVFDATQSTYLLGFMTETQLGQLEVVAATGPTSAPAIAALLTGTRLSADDKAMVIEHVKTMPVAAPPAPVVSGFPGAKAKPFATAPQATAFAPTPAPTLSLAQQVAALLSVQGRDGKVYEKGLAKVYRDNPGAWPTHDPFGRAFPSLQTIVTTMTKEQARSYFTGSGFPKVVLDGISYYIQDKAGKSATVLAQLHQQQHHLQQQENAQAAAENRMPRPIVIDQATVPDDIQSGDWRRWNGERGVGARYEVPARHTQLCAQLGIMPIEYEGLKPSQTAPVSAAQPAKRTRKARV